MSQGDVQDVCWRSEAGWYYTVSAGIGISVGQLRDHFKGQDSEAS